jgi:2-dehydro-3-deoxygluconokinase
VSWQVFTFGEAMLRLAAAPGYRLEQSQQLAVYVAGSELNVACLLARLGVSCAWASSLPDSMLGRIVTNTARSHGVDASAVNWLDARLGLLFTENGQPPRPTQVIYDRAHSAASQMCAADRDWQTLIAASDIVHLTGITPALSQGCAELCETVLQHAKGAGKLVSFDPNYRAKLWTVAAARAYFERLMPYVDIVSVSERDARVLFDSEGTWLDVAIEEVALALKTRYDLQSILVTASEASRHRYGYANALAWSDGQVYHGPAFEVEVVDRIGAGDSSAAGLLYGVLQADAAVAAHTSAALSALALTNHGDINWASAADVTALLGNLEQLGQAHAGQKQAGQRGQGGQRGQESDIQR